jgi:hypothetical protein
MIDIKEAQYTCVQTVMKLFKKYENNEYMLQRIVNHVDKYLPTTLDNELNNHETRKSRNIYLTSEQQTFIQIFLSKNRYFFLPSNNCFYEYNGVKYTIVNDDDILHNLLSSISKDRVLMSWKYKTKVNIIKQIKDRHLFSSIPETDTIQNTLNLLYPFVFSSKQQAKYFLTVVGDNILKKNTAHIFFVNLHVKKMLVELDKAIHSSIGVCNSTHNFMTKYHENHSYENCRLMKTNDNPSIDVWKDMLRNNGLDIVCVAVHYSNRYTNSDKFIEDNSDESLKDYTYYLKQMSIDGIIEQFSYKYLTTNTVDDIRIEWKNLHFVWKLFLSESSLPSMIYSNTLKTLLGKKFTYDEPSDSFVNITSKYLPIHSDFIKFWDNTINCHEDLEKENEIEIDELCSLFKYWVKFTNEQHAIDPTKLSLLSNGNINEQNIIQIMKHFFPNVVIVEDKYVLNISCILWDKNKDIADSFDFIKTQIKQDQTLVLISFDDAYKKYCNSKSHKFIVSKRFFEKFICHTLSDYIVYDKFIETTWITQNVAI